MDRLLVLGSGVGARVRARAEWPGRLLSRIRMCVGSLRVCIRGVGVNIRCRRLLAWRAGVYVLTTWRVARNGLRECIVARLIVHPIARGAVILTCARVWAGLALSRLLIRRPGFVNCIRKRWVGS